MNNRFADILSGITNKQQHRNESILLVDGLNLFLRNFCVINLLNKNGHHIGGLVGSMLSLGYSVKVTNPTRVIICFDGVGGSSNRKNLYPAYKGNRHKKRVTNYSSFSSLEEEDESISNQIGRLCNYFQCLPLSMICIDGLEADDVIGYLTEKYEEDPNTSTITIMSADEDFLQLISTKTQVYSPRKKKIYKRDDVIKEFFVTPENFIAKKALLGDVSDNVPGIQGLGPGKLKKLFPELASRHKIRLNEIISKADQNEIDNIIYSRVLAQKHQLDINFTIMSLIDLPISPENKQIIDEVRLEKDITMDKTSFLTMYYGDVLGDSIKNVESWVSSTFSYLANFK